MTTALDTPIFAGLNRRERNAARRLGTVVTLLDGREVTTQGDLGRQFGIVLSGELRVVRNDVEIARLRTGECFGEISLITGARGRQTATVEAVGNARVVVFSRPEFDELCALVPAVANRVRLVGLRRLASRSTS
jgi:CRP-like cAMP-binding protein